jgi:hypothetical protein
MVGRQVCHLLAANGSSIKSFPIMLKSVREYAHEVSSS